MDADLSIFRTLAERYAQAADRNRPEILDAIMADDIVLEGPGFRMSGLAEVRGFPAMLAQRFRGTRHLVHNQVVTVDGDAARGETCSTASHRLRETPQVLVWHLRYEDEFRRVGSDWRFARRAIVIDWTETRNVDPPG